MSVLPVAMLAVNEVTKAYFWTPHLQVFGILVPVMAVWLCVWAAKNFDRSGLLLVGAMGIAFGVAVVTYGSFLLLPLTLVFITVWRMPGGQGGSRLRTSVKLGVVLAGCYAVVASWRAYVVWRTGDFISLEVRKYHEFVWIREDAVKGIGSFLASIGTHALEFSLTIGPACGAAAIILGASWLAARWAGSKAEEIVPRELSQAIVVYMILAVPFLWLIGFYRTRLTWILVPPMLLISARALACLEQRIPPRSRLAAQLSTYAITLIYIIYWVTKSGPYS
jgi:hypothetical protein